ncbi:polyprenol phosphomannose-dependent alpha 1,6 mannosyltransferase MptB [Propionibacteriaceae bacterium Y1700]|uniref:polyprenol phosphomannose-dependent alpha 1,6 mannosyltransferase MptB n=1 Tax=Microlunatus sp. Y1700 TaxID=3418487 RepID=UPI003DA70A83
MVAAGSSTTTRPDSPSGRRSRRARRTSRRRLPKPKWKRPDWQGLRTRWSRGVDLVHGALATWPVAEGVLGSFLLALGSLTPAFLPRASQGGDLFRWTGVGTVLMLIGTSLILHGWFRLRPGRHATTPDGRRPRYLPVLALWVAPLLTAPPMFSGDAYSYAAQGSLMNHGLDPYQLGPAAIPGPWADQVDPMWLTTPAPYGPLSVALQYLTVAVIGDNVYVAAWAMRVWAMIGVGLLAYCIPRIANRLGLDPARAMWIGVLNPIVLLHFVGGAHNDALMMGFVALGLLLAVRRQLFWAAIAIGLATAMKQPAALAALPVAVLALRPIGDEPGPARGWPEPRQLVAFAWTIGLTVATFILVSTSTGTGFGWLRAVNVPGVARTLSPTTMLGGGLELLFGFLDLDRAAELALGTVRSIGLAIAGAIIVWLALRVGSRKPMTFLVAGLFAFVLGGPSMHAWYLLWPGVLVGLLPYSEKVWRVAIWLTTFWVCYAVADAAFRNQAPLVAWLAIAVSAWLLLSDERQRLADRVRTRVPEPEAVEH